MNIGVYTSNTHNVGLNLLLLALVANVPAFSVVWAIVLLAFIADTIALTEDVYLEVRSRLCWPYTMEDHVGLTIGVILLFLFGPMMLLF